MKCCNIIIPHIHLALFNLSCTWSFASGTKHHQLCLLTGINFNPSIGRYSHVQWRMGWFYLSIPKLQRCKHWSFGIDKSFHHTLYNGCNYMSMFRLKLTHVSKRVRHHVNSTSAVTKLTELVPMVLISHTKFFSLLRQSTCSCGEKIET